MKSKSFIKTLRKIFIEGNPIDESSFDFKELELSGIRLTRVYETHVDPRKSGAYNNYHWSLGFDLYEKVNHSGQTKQQWDMTVDGDYLCFRLAFNTYIIYEVEELDEYQIEWIQQPELTYEEENKRRESILPLLVKVLIDGRYPFVNLKTGELESKYGIHLKMIQKGPHRHLKYKPNSSGTAWFSNQVLSWGRSDNGWDITLDGKIACCRVEYDEYYNFEIEILGEKQKIYYEKKFQINKLKIGDLEDAIYELDEETLRKMKVYIEYLLETKHNNSKLKL